MEVFVAFTKGTDLARLEETLEAWNLPGLEPVAIQCGLKKFELHRRVAAENVSRGTYVLSTVDRGPVEDDFAKLAEATLAENPKAGMISVEPVEADWMTGAVSICRKGLIKQWVQPLSGQEPDVLWANAHRTSYRNAGFETITCPLIHYRLLAGSLPSSSGTARQS